MLCESHTMECKSILFVQTAYLIFDVHFKFFFQQFPWVLQLWRFFIKGYQKEWSIKLRINKLWIYFTYATFCDILHETKQLSRVRWTDWKSSLNLGNSLHIKKYFQKFLISAKVCQKDDFYALLLVLSGRFGDSCGRAGDLVCIR